MALWPGLSQPTSRVFQAIGMGANPSRFANSHVIRPATYYHRRNFPAAGVGSLEFFTANPEKYVTNWPSGSGLPNEFAMWLTGLSFVPEVGVDIDGAEDASAITFSDSLVTGFDVAQGVHDVFITGHVRGTVSDRVFADGYGLTTFPAGEGFSGLACIENTNSTVAGGAIHLTNGTPGWQNRFPLGAFPVLPNKAVKVQIDWETTITPADALNIKCVLHGVVVYPSNL